MLNEEEMTGLVDQYLCGASRQILLMHGINKPISSKELDSLIGRLESQWRYGLYTGELVWHQRRDEDDESTPITDYVTDFPFAIATEKHRESLPGYASDQIVPYRFYHPYATCAHVNDDGESTKISRKDYEKMIFNEPILQSALTLKIPRGVQAEFTSEYELFIGRSGGGAFRDAVRDVKMGMIFEDVQTKYSISKRIVESIWGEILWTCEWRSRFEFPDTVRSVGFGLVSGIYGDTNLEGKPAIVVYMQDIDKVPAFCAYTTTPVRDKPFDLGGGNFYERYMVMGAMNHGGPPMSVEEIDVEQFKEELEFSRDIEEFRDDILIGL